MASDNSLTILQDDLSFWLQQTEDETNTMIAGMLSLLHDNGQLNERLQNQNWCKRMFNTVLGKNRATAQEIRQNHDRLSAYMVQAVGVLYQRNQISNQMMVSLSLQITQLYQSHLELKEMLHGLVGKLNEKIESVDNCHLLLHEIDAGIYGDEPSVTALLAVIAQIDGRMISDGRKMRILERKMSNKNLLGTDNTLTVEEFLSEIMELNDERLSVVYADLQLYRTEYLLAELAIRAIESWNLLAPSNRRMLKRQAVLDRIVEEAGVDETATFTCDKLYDDIVALRLSLLQDAANGLAVAGELCEVGVCGENGDEAEDIRTVQCGWCGEIAYVDDTFQEGDEVECPYCGERICIGEEQSTFDSVDDMRNTLYENLRGLTESLEQLKDVMSGCTAGSGGDTAEQISYWVEYYLGSEDSCTVHTGYISDDLREKAKKNIVDKDKAYLYALSGAAIGGYLGGPIGAGVGAAVGAVLGNFSRNKQEYTCDADDIVAIVDASSSHNCGSGMVFTKQGVFFSQTADVSIYIGYEDICMASGTSGVLSGKLTVERYNASDFKWIGTTIPNERVADLLNELKNIC